MQKSSRCSVNHMAEAIESFAATGLILTATTPRVEYILQYSSAESDITSGCLKGTHCIADREHSQRECLELGVPTILLHD
jgi:hypothetical protein